MLWNTDENPRQQAGRTSPHFQKAGIISEPRDKEVIG